MPTWYTKQSKALFQAILHLRSPSEAKRFFRDLLTEEEILEFSRRWEAAQLLRQGAPYTTIVRRTGLSSTTVARVQRWLKGSQGGYRLMLARQHHTDRLHHSRLKEA
ncbi:MAG: YerC/YecD family TrpR-related protein [Patescibacteria group bacterium]